MPNRTSYHDVCDLTEHFEISKELLYDKSKITVLKKEFHRELAEEYGVSGITSCPFLTVGQEIYCEMHYKPDRICDEAWKAIQHYVYALYYGANKPFGKDWMKKAGIAIVTCNDGLRPVTFKIESVTVAAN